MTRFAFLLPFALCIAPLSGFAQASNPSTSSNSSIPSNSSGISPDWHALGDETTRILADYIRVNTTNPPGNELQGALYLQKVLQENGIESQILDTAELGHGRANIYARLRGSGAKKAIALVSHIDVVPVDARFWTVDPFAATVKDGFLYGRGTLDMKGIGIVELMAMIELKRSGVPLDRDIVFIGNADEELTSTGGIQFVKNHPDLLKDVEFLLTEGGDNEVHNGKLLYIGVGVAEKRTFWQQLTVHGVPSHGSRPTPQNPVPHIARALYRISQYQTPLHVTPGVRKYFHDIAREYQGQQRAWLSDIDASLKGSEARTWILSDVYWNAILRNTISETGMQGSNKTNVIPAEASAQLDVRLLPDQDPDAFLRTLQAVVADTAVHFTTLLPPKIPLESPVNTAMFSAIERAAHDRFPDALVTTPMYTAATDRPTYRKLGIVPYGIDPFLAEAADWQKGMHGNDERVSLENIEFGVHYLYDMLRYAQ